MTNLPDNHSKNYKGQALLIVLLVMAVSLTVVVSIASRSISDIATTKLEEESLRAFSAAETAVEEALKNPQVGTRTGTVGSETTEPESVAEYEVTVNTPFVNSNEFIHPSRAYSGEGLTFWFVGHDGDGNISCNDVHCYSGDGGSRLNVCWGNDGTASNNSSTPALELSVYYDTSRNSTSGDFSGIQVAKAVYDPNNGRLSTNNFSSAGNCDSVSGVDLQFSTGNVTFTSLGIPSGCVSGPGCLLMARAKLFYNSSPHSVGIALTNGNLPSQGIEVEATGKAGSSTRKLNVYQTHPEVPSILDNAIFSLNNLSK